MQQQWENIETAPKDGTSILLFDGATMSVAYWCDTGTRLENYEWVINEFSAGEYNSETVMDNPTHWMSLPKEPT